jgi:branched-chain amino acid transport system substrate-binding protein
MRLSRRAFGATALAGASSLMFGRARAVAAPVKIGVLTDMNGPLSSVLGTGSVDGARMAIEDFGGSVLGVPVELVSADHQSKADVGSAIAREWLDERGVDMIMDYGNSAVALACINIIREKNKVVIVTGAPSSDITGKFCTPNPFRRDYDTYMMTVLPGSCLYGAFLCQEDCVDGTLVSVWALSALCEASGGLHVA